MRSKGAVEDVHGALFEVGRKQERSGRVGIESDVGVRSLRRVIDNRNCLRPAGCIPGGNSAIERAEKEQGRCAAWNIEDSVVAVEYRAAGTAVRRRGSRRRYRNGGQRRYRNSAGKAIKSRRSPAEPGELPIGLGAPFSRAKQLVRGLNYPRRIARGAYCIVVQGVIKIV